MNKEIKTILLIASFSMAMAVGLGAVGTHVLATIRSHTQMLTFETGVRYQIIHSLALLIIATLHSKVVHLKPKWTYRLFIAGIILFSFNCYLYTYTGIKLFAYAIPFGGFAFILGWLFFINVLKRDL